MSGHSVPGTAATANQKRHANVVELPTDRRICSSCENGALSTSGVYCLVFKEQIWNEREAENCDAWQPF